MAFPYKYPVACMNGTEMVFHLYELISALKDFPFVEKFYNIYGTDAIFHSGWKS